MPTPGYICDSCEKFYEDKGQAEEHEKIPVVDSFPKGLILKKNVGSDSTDWYMIISSKKRVAQEPHDVLKFQVHDQIYGGTDVSHYSYREQARVTPTGFDYSASGIQRGLDDQSLSELSEQEFKAVLELIKDDEFLKIRSWRRSGRNVD